MYDYHRIAMNKRSTYVFWSIESSWLVEKRDLA